MSEVFSNDNGTVAAAAPNREPDAHGHAALLLVESVLHGLISHSLLSVGQAVALVDIAAEVKNDIGADLGDSRESLQRSLALLASIGTSLKADLKKS